MERKPLLEGMDEEGMAMAEEDKTAAVQGFKNQLGTLNGVYIPCVLNILGA